MEVDDRVATNVPKLPSPSLTKKLWGVGGLDRGGGGAAPPPCLFLVQRGAAHYLRLPPGLPCASARVEWNGWIPLSDPPSTAWQIVVKSRAAGSPEVDGGREKESIPNQHTQTLFDRNSVLRL